MAICLHPFMIGVPHRIGGLDAALEYVCGHDGVWLATGEEIARDRETLHREEHFGALGRGEVRVKSLGVLLEMLEQALEQA